MATKISKTRKNKTLPKKSGTNSTSCSKKTIYNSGDYVIGEGVDGMLCLACGEVLVSWWGHNFKTCSCPNRTMVDGGRNYTRYGGQDMKLVQPVRITPMSFVETANGD